MTGNTLVVRKRRRRLEVNIIPLVDVLTVLLFFFLVTMQFRDLTTLNITVPTMQTAGQSDLRDRIVIHIHEDGQIRINSAPVSLEELETALAIAGELNPEIPVLVVADEETMFRNVTAIMDVCRRNRLERIRLQVTR